MLRTGPRRALLYKRPAAAAASSWTPLLASTAAIWWIDADNSGSITSGGLGTEATQVNDLGTGARNMTPTTTGPTYTASVLNGKPGFDFSGGAYDLRTVSWFSNQPFMLVIVWKQSATAPGDYGILWESERTSSDGSRSIVQTKNVDVSNNYRVISDGIAYAQGEVISINTPYYTRIIFDGTDSASKLNTDNDTGITIGTIGIYGGIRLGGASGVVASKAIICEAFIIPYADHAAVLADAPTDCTDADAYVLAKWGI